MPTEHCRENGSPGWRYGKSGKCSLYRRGDLKASKEAKRNAEEQGRAARAAGFIEKEG